MSSREEQKRQALEVWEFQNRVRMDPSILIPGIQEDLRNFKGTLLWRRNEAALQTKEGPSAYQEAEDFLRRQTPVDPLEFHEALEAAALEHANDIGLKGLTGHKGTDGSSIGDRIDRYARWESTVGENVAGGLYRDFSEVIRQLVVDDGVPARGHRKNIFSQDFKVCGIAVAPHAQYGSTVVIDYAGGVSDSRTNAGGAPRQQSARESSGRERGARGEEAGEHEALPEGCVEKSTSTDVKTSVEDKGKLKITTITTTTTTTFKMEDGSTRIKQSKHRDITEETS